VLKITFIILILLKICSFQLNENSCLPTITSPIISRVKLKGKERRSLYKLANLRSGNTNATVADIIHRLPSIRMPTKRMKNNKIKRHLPTFISRKLMQNHGLSNPIRGPGKKYAIEDLK